MAVVNTFFQKKEEHWVTDKSSRSTGVTTLYMDDAI